MKRKYTRWSKELLEPVVKESTSIAQVLTKLNLKPTGGNYSNLKRNLIKYNLDFSHFTGQAWMKGSYKPLGELKCKKAIKDHIIRENEGEYCEICNITDWQGSSLTFELDHINGDNTDNTRSNLRILCPNCHSQTPTYRNQIRP